MDTTVPYLLAIWILGNDGSLVNHSHYFDNQHDCEVAKRVLVAELTPIAKKLKLKSKFEVGCLADQKVQVDQD